MTDIGSDDPETSRVIGIRDGARYIGWVEGIEEVASIIGKLARIQVARGLAHAQPGYPEALNDVLKAISEKMAERRKI